jgi:hypothetical protein
MYPQIDELDFDIESRTLMNKLVNSAHFSVEDTVPSRVGCGNHDCINGGYNINEIINGLYYAENHPNLQEKEGDIVCRGYEKMGVGTRSCLMAATYKVKIRYKQP